MSTVYRIENNYKYPSGPMLLDIEESCLYMIEVAKSSDWEKTLNHTTKTGETLFFTASIYSEKVTNRLLQEPMLQVNSITEKFMTPFLNVRLKVYFLKLTSSLVR